jgi:hypothetical protein
MAKKRKRTAKAAKTTKASAKQKAAKKKPAKKKTAGAKIRRKLKLAKKSKSVTNRPANKPAKTAAKKPVAMTPAKTTVGGKPVAPPPESLSHKIANAVGAVVDNFTDAERLHHKVDPGISNEPE